MTAPFQVNRWVAAAAKGDHDAFAALLAEVRPVIESVTRATLREHRQLQEDAAQEATIQVWKSLGKFDSKSNFRTWLREVVRNAVLAYLHKQGVIRSNGKTRQEATGRTYSQGMPMTTLYKLDRETGEEVLIEVIDPNDPSGGDPQKGTLDVELAISKLPAKRQLALKLELAGCSTKEIADQLRVKPNAVYQLLFDAKAQLAELLNLKLAKSKAKAKGAAA